MVLIKIKVLQRDKGLSVAFLRAGHCSQDRSESSSAMLKLCHRRLSDATL